MKHALLICLTAGLLFGCDEDPTDSNPTWHNVADEWPSENSIANFHTVHPYLFRSGDIHSGDMDVLQDEQIKTILSLEDYQGSQWAADAEEESANDAGIDFVWQPLSPSEKPTLAQINKALAVMNDPEQQPVLVHCKHGADRTGIVLAAYRIRYDHWSKADAVEEMRSLGHFEGLYWWDDVLDDVEND